MIDRNPRKKGTFLRFAAFTTFAAVSVYAFGAAYFSGHYLPETRIMGEDVSFRDLSYAEKVISEKCGNAQVAVKFRGGKTEKTSGAEIGLAVAGQDRVINDIFSLQQDMRWKWPAHCLEEKNYNITPRYDADQRKLSLWFLKLPETQKENMSPPEDAEIDRHPDVAAFYIKKETEGTTLNAAAALSYVNASVHRGDLRLCLKDVPGIYEEPSVRGNDGVLIEKLKKLNTAVSGGISYVLPDGGTIDLGPDTLIDWVSEDDGEYYIDEDAWYENAAAFADDLYEECSTVWEEREFESTDSGTVTVPGGTYGYIVDKDGEINEIMGIMDSGEFTERAPLYTQEESEDRSNHGIGSTYVEVSIGEQHLWYYEDGDLVLDSPVVTGTRGSHDTPRGQYRVQFTQRNAVLIGRPDANGNPSYRTPVSYWMPFYNGCGLHDANWRSSFGGSIFTYSGSHGCVNMPPTKAERLFDYVSAGTVVVIY